MKLLRAADRLAVPWKNGGGVTCEVAVFPPGARMEDFGWRISVADVGVAGPFSRFDGIDRILTVLEGRLSLRFIAGDRTAILEPGQNLAFAGDVEIVGTPIDGLVRDLNVMVRRDEWRADVSPWDAALPKAGTRLAVATARASGLNYLDALLLDEGENPPPDFAGHLIRLAKVSA